MSARGRGGGGGGRGEEGACGGGLWWGEGTRMRAPVVTRAHDSNISYVNTCVQACICVLANVCGQLS